MFSTRLTTFAALAALACGTGARNMNEPSSADLVLLGGDLRTMDSARPRATALAIRGGRILAVGDDASIRGHIGAKTRIVELAGRTVTPGLVDGHCHLYGLGKSLEILSLRGITSEADVAKLVGETVQGRAAGEWIEGRGWDQNLWSPEQFPSRASLDAVAPDHPVSLRRIDGHALWANSVALIAAGITRDTPDPAGGKIIRDDKGEPTGTLVDNAMNLVERRIPPPTAQVIRRRILAAAGVATRSGLTGVHEMGLGLETVRVYEELELEGALPLRVYGFLEGSELAGEVATRAPELDPDGTGFFVLRGVKMYADGALGSRGAHLLAPYADDPENVGLGLMTPAELTAAADLAAKHGWQLGVHAIGDRANREVLDAIAALPGDKARLRFRIEHAQVVAPEDFQRFADLGVISAMQPTHATSDMPWAEERLGAVRVRGAYSWRTMLDRGVHLLGGSDFPIEEVGPLLQLHAAVRRTDAAGNPEGGWQPEQRLTLDEAIRIHTVEAAYASFSEAHRGRLTAGMVADLTVFDRALDETHLLETRVDLTVVGGAIMHERR
jgi:predicted amidohydrolase YtcJ